MTTIIPCVCLTCGVRNDFSHPDGLCRNGHDDWLEYRDFSHMPEVVQRAMKLTKLSRNKLQKLFMNVSVKQIKIYEI